MACVATVIILGGVYRYLYRYTYCTYVELTSHQVIQLTVISLGVFQHYMARLSVLDSLASLRLTENRSAAALSKWVGNQSVAAVLCACIYC